MPAQAWVALIVGGVAAVGAVVNWYQRNRSDRRSEWWRRTSWAYERTFSDNDEEARVGWEMLRVMVRSRLATQDDSDIVQVVGEQESLGTAEEDEYGDGPETVNASRAAGPAATKPRDAEGGGPGGSGGQ
ncbi:MAG: hypothetical protein PHQ28_00260 [Mycobacterium sp.]|nr:hypothetical protein [Mycobacterium sp.]